MRYDGQELDIVNPRKTSEAEQTELAGERANQVDQLTQQLEAEQRKSEEYLDLLRRTQADFINYKRRTDQEQNEERIAAQIALLDQILPVLDDLGRALQSTPPELADQPWVLGIMLVARRLMSALEQLGVRQVGRPGEQFDPRWHEALAMQAQPGAREGTILQVTRPGYALGERVIRPAQVIVAGSV
jgi:molecular chaperone GrpE